MNYIILFFIFFLGLIIGSFLNCLIWRLHKGEGMWNRSYCPLCRQPIAWYDNIPVLSFILLRGKCRHCGKPISWQYPIVELVTGVLFVSAVICPATSLCSLPTAPLWRSLASGGAWWAGSRFGGDNLKFVPPLYYSLGGRDPARAVIIWSDFIIDPITNYQLLITVVRDWFIIAVMIVIFIYDLRWNLILDKITLPACLVVFILNLTLGVSWLALVVSAAMGGGFFLIQFLVSRGKWIGGGDIRLGFLMGFSLGYPSHLILAILAAYFIGSVTGLSLIIFKKKKWNSEVPLGVFLTSATIFTIFWGDKVINWYLGLF